MTCKLLNRQQTLLYQVGGAETAEAVFDEPDKFQQQHCPAEDAAISGVLGKHDTSTANPVPDRNCCANPLQGKSSCFVSHHGRHYQVKPKLSGTVSETDFLSSGSLVVFSLTSLHRVLT